MKKITDENIEQFYPFGIFQIYFQQLRLYFRSALATRQQRYPDKFEMKFRENFAQWKYIHTT